MVRLSSYGKELTSREAAQLLGVSEASVKRWADGGLLPMAKTAGGHRRFRPEDVAVFRRRGFSESAQAQRASGGRRDLDPGVDISGETEELFYEALLDGRGEQGASILGRLHLNGKTSAQLADSVICPAMRRIGELWHCGDLSVAQEHVATLAAQEALKALRTSVRNGNAHGKLAICCSTEGDFHDLPVQLASIALEENGWGVINLGSSTPFYSLAEVVERYSPKLVCVASTVLEGLDRAARDYSILSEATNRIGNALVLGGQGLTREDVRDRFPADLHADSFGELERFIHQIAKKDEPNAFSN